MERDQHGVLLFAHLPLRLLATPLNNSRTGHVRSIVGLSGRTSFHPLTPCRCFQVMTMSLREPTSGSPEEAELRSRLTQRRLLRRIGLSISLPITLCSGFIAASDHITPLFHTLPFPGASFSVASTAIIVSCILASSRFLRMEVGLDGVLYCSKRHPRLQPLRNVRSAIDVRHTDDGRGRGAFALRKIPANTCLGRYRGELLDNASFFTLYDTREGSSNFSEYAICVDSEFVIDGKEAAAADIFTPGHMNHSRLHAEINVQRIYLRRKRRIVFYTTRDVEEGEELRFNYGKHYWQGREHLEI